MRKFVATIMVAGALFVAAPAVAQAEISTHQATVAAKCVETSFWGRFASLFVSRSYAAYLWQVKC